MRADLKRWQRPQRRVIAPAARRDACQHCLRQADGQVSVTLGPITVDNPHLPLVSGPLKDGVALSIGNPHAVFFVDEDVDIPAAAPAIARDPLFPDSVNVGVAQVLDQKTLKLAVWERPGMLTEACGTGACAAVVAGIRWGLLDARVDVDTRGGVLTIAWAGGDAPVLMTGPAVTVFTGEIEFPAIL